eukprot:jgi/Mesvir1/1192/Mv25699-RA.1
MEIFERGKTLLQMGKLALSRSFDEGALAVTPTLRDGVDRESIPSNDNLKKNSQGLSWVQLGKLAITRSFSRSSLESPPAHREAHSQAACRDTTPTYRDAHLQLEGCDARPTRAKEINEEHPPRRTARNLSEFQLAERWARLSRRLLRRQNSSKALALWHDERMSFATALVGDGEIMDALFSLRDSGVDNRQLRAGEGLNGLRAALKDLVHKTKSKGSHHGRRVSGKRKLEADDVVSPTILHKRVREILSENQHNVRYSAL